MDCAERQLEAQSALEESSLWVKELNDRQAAAEECVARSSCKIARLSSSLSALRLEMEAQTAALAAETALLEYTLAERQAVTENLKKEKMQALGILIR